MPCHHRGAKRMSFATYTICWKTSWLNPILCLKYPKVSPLTTTLEQEVCSSLQIHSIQIVGKFLALSRFCKNSQMTDSEPLAKVNLNKAVGSSSVVKRMGISLSTFGFQLLPATIEFIISGFNIYKQNLLTFVQSIKVQHSL